MNILVPTHWLQDHLETTATPQEIQKHVSLCGPSVEHIYDRDGDQVFDIEVTTNRVDSMSVRGFAREAAVILTNAGFPSELKPLELIEPERGETSLPLPTIDNTQELCQRILAVVLTDVKHNTTPDWMTERLHQVDLNVKDVVIDITNYLSHELGHPCHAFDYDKIMNLGGVIRVVEAQAGQEFTTLDGQTYTTVGGEVVFENDAGEIIDLPGIMGTQNSAVDENTHNVLFWIESIAPEKIRFASMTHGIRTPAAQLNERDLDHNLGLDILLKGIQLYQELTGAQQASPLYDEKLTETILPAITLTRAELFRYLGVEIDHAQVVSILQALGCTVNEQAEQSLEVIPPSFRTDLAIPADLVEEVARIYGYHNLPSELMATAIPTTYPKDTNFELERMTRQLLADLGYQELLTYSMISRELAANTPEGIDQHVTLKNPLTSDQEYMRRHLVPSHLEAMRSQWQTTTLRGTFELGNVYDQRAGELPDEHLMLGIVDRDFRALRTSLDVLIKRLHLDTKFVEVSGNENENNPEYQSIFRSSGVITLNGRVLGTIGYLPNGMAGLELVWREVLAVAKPWPHYQAIPKTSAYYEDWTFALLADALVGDIIREIYQSSELVQSVDMIDQYENRYTFRVTFLDRQKQLSAENLDALRPQVISQVKSGEWQG